MTLATPILVTKSPRAVEESNLDPRGGEVSGRCRTGVYGAVQRYSLPSRATNSLPLLSGCESSLSHPVYSIVTVSPAFGETPVPSWMMVFVKPMAVSAGMVSEKYSTKLGPRRIG